MEAIAKFDMTALNQNHKFMYLINQIEISSKNIVNGYLKLGKALKEFQEDKLYKLLKYDSIYDFAEKEYNFSKTAVKNLIAVYDKFSDKKTNYLQLDEKYKNFNYTQLVELVPVDETELSNFKPEMTAKEIRYKKIEGKVKNDFNKCLEFCKTKLMEELEKAAKAAGLNYKLKIEDGGVYSSYKLTIRFDTTLRLGYNFVLYLEEGDEGYYLSYRDFEYESHKLDVSIALVLKYLNQFLEKVIPRQKELLKKIEQEKQEKEEEKKKLLAEGKELPKSHFKNDKEREAFVNDLNNYELLYDLPLIKIRYYQNKDYPEIIVKQIYASYYSDYKIFDYYLYQNKESGLGSSVRVSEIIQFLKDK